MGWKQTANAGYLGQSSDGTPVEASTPGYFAQGTDGPPQTATPGYFGLGGTQGPGFFGLGGNEPTNPAYFGQGNR